MKLRIWGALLTLYIVWGSTYLAIRFSVETLPPFLLAAFRFLMAGGLLMALMRLRGAAWPTRREWRTTAVVGIFLLLGGNGLVTWAEQHVVSGVAALIIGSTPLWIVLVDALRPGGRRPSALTLLGVLVGFAGIALLIGPGSFQGAAGGVDLLGAGALALASLLWAIGSIYGREHHAELPRLPLLATSMEMLAGGAAMLLVATLLGEWGRLDLAAVTPRSAWALLYLVLVGSLLGYTSYSWLLGVAPTTLVSTYAYVNPLVAVFLGYLFADEPLTLRVLLAAGVIVSAVVLINLAQSRRLAAARTPLKPVE
ncbi:MAG: EamA family transporter [Chloroflexota bacterium]